MRYIYYLTSNLKFDPKIIKIREAALYVPLRVDQPNSHVMVRVSHAQNHDDHHTVELKTDKSVSQCYFVNIAEWLEVSGSPALKSKQN